MSEGVLRGAWRKMNLGAVDWVEITRGSTQGFPDCLTWISPGVDKMRDVAIPTELKIGSLTFTGLLKARVRAVQVGWHQAAWQRGRASAVVVSVPKPRRLGLAEKLVGLGSGGQRPGSPDGGGRAGAAEPGTGLESHYFGPTATSQVAPGVDAVEQEASVIVLGDEHDPASHDQDADQAQIGSQFWRPAYGRVAVLPGFKISCLLAGIPLSDPSVSILEVKPCRDSIARIMRRYIGLAGIN
jgi:hypothetical protein